MIFLLRDFLYCADLYDDSISTVWKFGVLVAPGARGRFGVARCPRP